jgi:RNA 3'-terminal phosphate cyclase (ATP)
MIELDGSTGEGGGQILRTSLTLAMITGRPFRIRQIRARRAKPGLMRQHLVAVQAAAQICGAEVSGATLGSQELEFVPGPIRGGDYRFAIGTAGSCTLVLQTVLPALLTAERPSTLHLQGGTHNPMAPPVQFLQRAFCRLLAEMGAQVEVHLERFGFYPAGGGEVTARVTPCAQLQPRSWMERGERKAAYAESFTAGIPPRVAQRELECVGKAMNWGEDQLLARRLPDSQGPGNALMLTLDYAHTTEVFTAFGEKSVSAENVARQAVQRARQYLCTKAAVSEYLGDQLMLPLALAGGGGFTVDEVSMHARTNAEVIERFLPVRFEFGKHEGVDAITVHPR